MVKRRCNYLILILYPVFFYVTFIDRGTIRSNVMLALIYFLLLISTVVTMVSNSITIKINHFIMLYLSFALFNLSSLLWATDFRLSLYASIKIMSFAVLFIVLYSYFISIGLTEYFLWSYIAISFMMFIHVVALLGIERIGDFSRRITAIPINANDIGMCASFAFLCCIYLFLNHKTVLPIVLSLPLLILSFLSGSRKAILILVLGTVAYILYHIHCTSKLHIKLFNFLTASAVIILLLLALNTYSGGIANSDIVTRFISMLNYFTGDGNTDGSTLLRMRFIEVGMDMFRENPLVGVGANNAIMFNGGLYLHNNFIEILANVGLIGFILYYSLYVVAFRKLWPHIKNKNTLAGFVSIALILQLILDYGYVSYNLFFTISKFLFIMCVADGNHIRARSSEGNPLYVYTALADVKD